MFPILHGVKTQKTITWATSTFENLKHNKQRHGQSIVDATLMMWKTLSRNNLTQWKLLGESYTIISRFPHPLLDVTTKWSVNDSTANKSLISLW